PGSPRPAPPAERQRELNTGRNAIDLELPPGHRHGAAWLDPALAATFQLIEEILGAVGDTVPALVVPHRSLGVGHPGDTHRDGEDQRWVLAGRDLDSVGVSNAEPTLGDLGHLVVSPLDRVLVIDDVPLGLEIRAAADVDGEALA